MTIRQAIETKYICPTNFRGSRVVAKAQAGRVIVDWDDALDSDENHFLAAMQLAKKLSWPWSVEEWIGGGLAGGRGNVYVQLEKRGA